MSEKWRLPGALEASDGVLVFGLSAGTLLSVMNRLFAHHTIAGHTIAGHTIAGVHPGSKMDSSLV